MASVAAMVNSTMSAVPPGVYQKEPWFPLVVLTEGAGLGEGLAGRGLGVQWWQLGGSKSRTVLGQRKFPTGGVVSGPREGPPVTLNQPCSVVQAVSSTHVRRGINVY